MSSSNKQFRPGQADQAQSSSTGYNLKLDEVEAVAREHRLVQLSATAVSQLRKQPRRGGTPVEQPGDCLRITTGFGKFKDVYIAPEDSVAMQRNFLRSHACGVGPLLDEETVMSNRAVARQRSGQRISGIRPEVVELLVSLLNQAVHPCIPEQGSVGRLRRPGSPGSSGTCFDR